MLNLINNLSSQSTLVVDLSPLLQQQSNNTLCSGVAKS